MIHAGEQHAPDTTMAEADDTVFVSPVKADLDDLCVRFRTFMETTGGDYSIGAEMAMQRAADMLENIINRHFEEPEIG